MGFTRARRYANHKDGVKYKSKKDDKKKFVQHPYSYASKNKSNTIIKQEKNALTNEKAKAAQIFKVYWFKAKNNAKYIKQKFEFKKTYYKK